MSQIKMNPSNNLNPRMNVSITILRIGNLYLKACISCKNINAQMIVAIVKKVLNLY